MGSKSVTAPLDEDEVKLGFLGSPAERELAFEKLFRNYSRRIVAFIEQRYPGLPSDLSVDAMVESFRALYDDVENGSFDVDRPLEPYIFSIANRKAIDQLRKFGRRPQLAELSEDEDGCTEIAAALAGTETGAAWSEVVQQAAANEIASRFKAFLADLPPVQRQVAQVLAEHFPAGLQHSEICDEILRRTGHRPTSIQVKSALKEIRRKFDSLLTAQERRTSHDSDQ